MPLTDAKIRNAKPSERPVKLTDSGGLYIEVRPTGKKLWRYRYRISGKENVYAIGEYFPDKSHPEHISLEAARRQRDMARTQVKQGQHPAQIRKVRQMTSLAENANTFEAVALEWMAQKKPRWGDGYFQKVQSTLVMSVFPYIGNMPIRSVTAAHLLEIIQRVAGYAPTVAVLIRQWASAVFRYATITLRADGDPAAALKGVVQVNKTVHAKPLSREQISILLSELQTYGGYRQTVIALRLLLLTFVRKSELRAAKWSEFDFEHSLWRIPAQRMKMGEIHVVPMSRQVLDLLRELHQFSGNREFLFPNLRSPRSFMTATTLNRALERMGFGGASSTKQFDFSPHGFRATASSLLNELGYRADVIERQLAHAERNQVRASYNQAEYMNERRQMMQDWADMISAIEEKILQPHGE